MHHKPKTIFFTLKNYTYWKPIRKGLCEKVPFLFLYPLHVTICRNKLFLLILYSNKNETTMNRYAVIVAGGTGSRFGSTLPKQFVPLNGEPVLMHSVRTFHAYDPTMEIIVVLPNEYQTLWNDICKQYQFTIPHRIVVGGENRFESVKNALYSIKETEGFVAVHDGARPLIDRQTISDGFGTAERCGSAIPVIPVTDSIRQLDRQGSHTINRDTLVAVQTPQVFKLTLLKEAYNTAFSPMFTDDASVVEYRGTDVTLYKGNVRNLKITHPDDIKIAEIILKK